MAESIPENLPRNADDFAQTLENANIAYELTRRHADFSLYIVSPVIQPTEPPVMINPEKLDDGRGEEFVYPIRDRGFSLCTSRGEESLYAGMSMCKLHYTIEKIIAIFIERIRKIEGVTAETEIQVAFGGFDSARRKAFEVIINLKDNVSVVNFEPGMWGERYLNMVKVIADKGYGYPSEAPRYPYRSSHGGSSGPKR